MGGNLKLNNIKAQKIPIKKIGRQQFIKDINELLETLNKDFHKKYGKFLWDDEHIKTALIFNGSTSFIMDNNISDEDILPYKDSAGDIDVIVNKDLKNEFLEFIHSFKGKQITPVLKQIGCKHEESKATAQEHCLYEYNTKIGNIIIQIDWEFTEYEYIDKDLGVPSEWAKFGHSSSIDDLQIGVKAVMHKYLIRSIAYAISKIPDVIFVTKNADCNNWEKKIKKNQDQHILKFSVDKGIRSAYIPLICDGQEVIKDGKRVFKELDTKESKYATKLVDVFEMLFNKKPTNQELKQLWSFKGLVGLIKKYLDKKQIDLLSQRFFELNWDDKAQKLERDSAELDFQIKKTAWDFLEKEFPFIKKNYNPKQVTKYYQHYNSLIKQLAKK